MPNTQSPPDPVREAIELGQQGQYRQAILKLETVPGLDTHAAALSLLAHFHYMLTEYTTARLYSEKSLALNPRRRLALTTLGEVLVREHRIEDAVDRFRDAHRYHSSNPYIARRLAELLLDSNDPRSAIQVLETTRIHTPQDEGLLSTLAFAYYCIGDHTTSETIQNLQSEFHARNIRESGDLDIEGFVDAMARIPAEERIRRLRQLMSLPQYSNHPRLIAAAAKTLVRLEQWEAACAAYEKLVNLLPRVAGYRIRLAECLVETGKPSDAIVILNEIHSETDPRCQVIHVKALIGTNSYQAAMNLAYSALLAHPRNDALRELLNDLRKQGYRPDTAGDDSPDETDTTML